MRRVQTLAVERQELRAGGPRLIGAAEPAQRADPPVERLLGEFTAGLEVAVEVSQRPRRLPAQEQQVAERDQGGAPLDAAGMML